MAPLETATSTAVEKDKTSTITNTATRSRSASIPAKPPSFSASAIVGASTITTPITGHRASEWPCRLHKTARTAVATHQSGLDIALSLQAHQSVGLRGVGMCCTTPSHGLSHMLKQSTARGGGDASVPLYRLS